jgi:hypothetical protein
VRLFSVQIHHIFSLVLVDQENVHGWCHFIGYARGGQMALVACIDHSSLKQRVLPMARCHLAQLTRTCSYTRSFRTDECYNDCSIVARSYTDILIRLVHALFAGGKLLDPVMRSSTARFLCPSMACPSNYGEKTVRWIARIVRLTMLRIQ